jgi:hypothetical protein
MFIHPYLLPSYPRLSGFFGQQGLETQGKDDKTTCIHISILLECEHCHENQREIMQSFNPTGMAPP